jgi:prolyl oligopeptidase
MIFQYASASAMVLLGLVTGSIAADQPPHAAKMPFSENLFGVQVTDSYRYMENLNDPAVKAWATAQGAFARQQLDAIPARQTTLERIAELDESVPAKVEDVKMLSNGELVFLSRNVGEGQSKLRLRGADGQEHVLVDADEIRRKKGIPVSITYFFPSPSSTLLAYGLAENGSEDSTIHILDLRSLREVDQPINRAQFSDISWLTDSSGFFYVRQRALPANAPSDEHFKEQSSFLHKIGDTSTDVEILKAGASKNPPILAQQFPYVYVQQNSPMTVAIPGNGVQAETSAYVTDRKLATAPGAHWRKLYDMDAAVTGFVTHRDDLYLLTHDRAPRFKVLRTSLSKPDLAKATEVVPASSDVLTGIAEARDALYISASSGSGGKLYRLPYGKGAKPVQIPLGIDGAVILAASNPAADGVVVLVKAWTRTQTYLSVWQKTGEVRDTGLQPSGKFGVPDGLVAEEVNVKSHDGVMVPLSIVAPRAYKKDGSNPVLLTGYGAYGISKEPSFEPRQLAWHELGGISATCHVRGGGEFGEAWHLAGKGSNKPNTWLDATACAEYLIQHGYTSPDRLTLLGRSAGGILAGRAMTERPDLFAAVIAEVPDVNMLRSEFSITGPANTPEFGSVSNAQQFHDLSAMDALSHVRDGVKYPALLLMHGLNDSRVPVWQSLKFAASVAAATTSAKPVLLRLDSNDGHGLGRPKSQSQQVFADQISFMMWQIGDKRFAPEAR